MLSQFAVQGKWCFLDRLRPRKGKYRMAFHGDIRLCPQLMFENEGRSGGYLRVKRGTGRLFVNAHQAIDGQVGFCRT